MNDVRLHVPYIFGNKQKFKKGKEKKIRRQTERDQRKKQKGERPAVGQEKQERGKAKAR